MPNGKCRMHGGKATGTPKGNQNAWKHGGCSSTRGRPKNDDAAADGQKLITQGLALLGCRTAACVYDQFVIGYSSP